MEEEQGSTSVTQRYVWYRKNGFAGVGSEVRCEGILTHLRLERWRDGDRGRLPSKVVQPCEFEQTESIEWAMGHQRDSFSESQYRDS